VAPTAELVAKSAGGDAELAAVAETLGRVGGEGVPTVAELRQGLDAVGAEEAAKAQTPAGEGPAGWLGAAQRNLGTLVDLHPTDAPGATPSDEAGRAAREALAAGDLEAAKAAVRPLAEGGNAAARSWVEAVERRQAVAAAADRLAGRLQAGFAPQ
jgi:hypothetical protein